METKKGKFLFFVLLILKIDKIYEIENLIKLKLLVMLMYFKEYNQ